MDTMDTLTDTTRAVEVIEDATRSEPFCGCGSHTVIVERDGGLSLVCAMTEEPMPRIRRLFLVDLADHVDHRVLDFAEWKAA
jgi:hypothetical protein